MARYSKEFRAGLVKKVAEKSPTYPELLRILERAKVPRTTFQYWWRQYQELGALDENQRGRPPAGFRAIVRQEIERGLRQWFGEPSTPAPTRSRS